MEKATVTPEHHDEKVPILGKRFRLFGRSVRAVRWVAPAEREAALKQDKKRRKVNSRLRIRER